MSTSFRYLLENIILELVMEECGVVSLKLKVLCTKSVLYLKLCAVNVLCSVERDID